MSSLHAFHIIRAAFCAACLALPSVVQAQTNMTEAEMTEAFSKQKTRGLAIAPVSQGTAEQPDAATEVSLTELPKDEQVNVNIVFDFDSAALREDQKPKLEALCNAVAAADVQRLRIIGHTDASGSAAYNERLSELRAVEVKRFLVRECGMDEMRLEAVGVGERFPYDEDDPRADVNRRVEFQALG
ncbi:OmpA family protein [Rhodosalinus halophilus]|nr:OmpA family protein [Rhodosalinus halophilus]